MKTNNMATIPYGVESMTCDPRKNLLSCGGFYHLLERFCNDIVTEQPGYEDFFQRYFNDEGYVDIWRIPHVMIDVLQRNMKFNRVLQHKEFREIFHRFIVELYDFCIKECLLETPATQQRGYSAIDTAQRMRARHRFLDELMSTFALVLENIECDSAS